MALPLFALTLFTSAFLLFLVQPMIGKLVLPVLGGTPQVWNTCMVFFQTVLLLGYFYTHAVSSKLKMKQQVLVHGILLFIPLIFLLPPIGPFIITGFEPPPGANPIWATLLFLAFVVGIPFFVVSTSAPLLQKWFSQTGHPSSEDPYFLYGASNLGSLLSLILYPILIEPFLVLPTQKWVYVAGYIVLIGMVLLSIAVALKYATRLQLAGAGGVEPPPPELPVPPAESSTAIKSEESTRQVAAPPSPPSTSIKSGPAPTGGRAITRKKGPKQGIKTLHHEPMIPKVDLTKPREDKVTWGRRIRWVMLSAIPSSLMLGLIDYISTDLSPFPLVWVFPLALYLLTFILVFSKWPLPWTGAPHSAVLFIMPLFPVFFLIYLVMLSHNRDPIMATLITWIGFFITTLMCHGELARDRPKAEHLTEYFLALSLGGMLGGLFNGILAPLLFWGHFEYPLAIVLACLLRPRQKDSGWVDELILSNPGTREWVEETSDEVSRSMGKPVTHSPFVLNYLVDIGIGVFVLVLTYFLNSYYEGRVGQQRVIGVMKFLGFGGEGAVDYYFPRFHTGLVFFIPCVIAVIASTRPLRFALCVASVLFVGLYVAEGRAGVIYSGRTYFGVIHVIEKEDSGLDGDGKEVRITRDRYLMHGTTDFGHNFVEPEEYRRLSTMYYHRYGPLGFAMERYNWFPGKQNTYTADARMPASLVGASVAQSLGVGNLPLEAIVDAQSTEPPYAVIGLGTGTMASYARAYQHLAYYEIDNLVKSFSIPSKEGKEPYFYFLADATKRRTNVEVLMGDARQTMTKENGEVTYLNGNPKHIDADKGLQLKRDKYYKVIVVDAFSSDAIPIHLITKEAIQLYFDKLTDDGVVCVHTSNRHLDLVLPVSDIANELGLKYQVGHLNRESGVLGITGSEYVLLARDMKYIKYDPATKWPPEVAGTPLKWDHPTAPGNPVWTDNYSNIVSILNVFSPRRGR